MSGFEDQLAAYRGLAEDWGSMGSEKVLDRLTDAEDGILAHVVGLEMEVTRLRKAWEVETDAHAANVVELRAEIDRLRAGWWYGDTLPRHQKGDE